MNNMKAYQSQIQNDKYICIGFDGDVSMSEQM